METSIKDLQEKNDEKKEATQLDSWYLFKAFSEEEDMEAEEALTSLLSRFETKLETTQLNGDYVFFIFNGEMLRSFTNTIYTLAKATSVFTFHFSDQGLHQTEVADTEKATLNLHLYRHFFHFYQIEAGLEISIAVLLEEFLLQQLFLAKKKEACDLVYFVATNAGIASWIVCSRTPKERSADFCPKVNRKSNSMSFPGSDTNGLGLSTPEDELEEDEKSQFFIDPSTINIECQFTLLSDRVIKNATTFAKDKQALRNMLYVHYQNPPNILNLCPSTKSSTDKSNKCSMFHIETFENKDPAREIDFKGTFSHSVMTSLCKLASKLYLGLILSPKPILALKIFFRELSLPRQPSSYLEIFLFDEDSHSSPE